MKRLLLAGAIVLVSVATVGCSPKTDSIQADKRGVSTSWAEITEIDVTLTDGSTIPCIIFDRGIDCDWDSKK